MRFKTVLREPLVHFALIGAALFLIFQIKNDGAESTNPPIVISSGQIEQLTAQFASVWQRPPSSSELKNLIDEAIREELAVREALSMGLERDDVIIRRRLRQKLEFLLQDAIESTAPTDQQLQAWLEQHPDSFRVGPKLALRQVYFAPNLHGDELEAELNKLQQQLQTQGPNANLAQLGDRSLLPQEVPLQSSFDIARNFGQEFAEQVENLPVGAWSKPVLSGYGVHLVLVQEHIDGSQPDLNEVRPQVEREFMVNRSKQQQAAMYERLLDKYHVVIEPASTQPKAQDGSGS